MWLLVETFLNEQRSLSREINFDHIRDTSLDVTYGDSRKCLQLGRIVEFVIQDKIKRICVLSSCSFIAQSSVPIVFIQVFANVSLNQSFLTQKTFKYFLLGAFPVDGTNICTASRTRTPKQHEGCQRRRWVTLLAPHVCIRRWLNVHSGRRSLKENSSALSYSPSIAKELDRWVLVKWARSNWKVASKIESLYLESQIWLYQFDVRTGLRVAFCKILPRKISKKLTAQILFSTRFLDRAITRF